MVECNLAKVEVAGSNPVSRSILSAQARSKAWLFCVLRRTLRVVCCLFEVIPRPNQISLYRNETVEGIPPLDFCVFLCENGGMGKAAKEC